MSLKKPKKYYVKWSLLSLLVGVLVGIMTIIFLMSLNFLTELRNMNSSIIWALPLCGFFIGWVYYKYGQSVSGGSNLIIDEIHNPQKVIPLRMVPLIICGTLLTHLFGGSAGREGSAVQMGASISDQMSAIFKLSPDDRKTLLVIGAGAGFGSAIGVPLAGAVFGMEIIFIGRLKLFAFFECLVASYTAYYTANFLSAPHSHFELSHVDEISLKTLFLVILAGAFFGLAANIFSMITHKIESIRLRYIDYPPLKPFLAGTALVLLYYIEGSYKYAGLGIPIIQDAFIHLSSFSQPALKIFFTAITVGGGFKGGEFVPLVFIGSTLGSALSKILSLSIGLLAALGFAAVFAGASNAPLACSLMAIELFGLKIAPYSFLACYVSYYFSGHHGIYKSQKIYINKHLKVKNHLFWVKAKTILFIERIRK